MTARIICSVLFILGGAGASVAQAAPLPAFATCMAGEFARFERELAGINARLDRGQAMPFADISGVEFCGTVAIVICDRSEAPLPCQTALAVEQDILRARVLHELPDPKVAQGATFADDLYDIVWALAHGISAGPDCAGTNEVMEKWCRTREANGRLRAAVLAWQVARRLDHAPHAKVLGWIGGPEKIRPRSRPIGGD